MSSIASSTAPLVLAPTTREAAITLRRAVLLAVIACAVTFLFNVYWRESYTGDEGFYGVTAQNMLHGSSYWLRPSYYPMGDFAADRDGFAHPPFNSYFYAVGLWFARGSLVGPEIINTLALAALLIAGYRILATTDALAAGASVALLVASPALLGYYSMLEAEPLMTTFGLAALGCCLRGGYRRGERAWFFAGGLCLGMSFALKLWLFGPLVLAVGAALIVRAWNTRPALTDYVLSAAVIALGIVLPAAAHLAAVAIWSPGDLSFWVRNIYFGIFTHAGISGSKFGGAAIPASWVHPVWYYGAALYRDEFFLLPPIVFGLRSAWTEGARTRQMLFVLGAGIAGVVPLSLIKVKEPLYVLTCAVFLYLFAAVCLAAMIRRLKAKRLDGLSFVGGAAICGLMLLAIPAAYVRCVQGDKITLAFVIAHSAVYAAFLAVVLAATRLRRALPLERFAYLGCAAAFAIGAIVYAVAHRPRDVEIGRLVKPYVADVPPTALTMFASNFKCYQYYTFAKGCYWHDLDRGLTPEAMLARPEYRDVRVFILDPDDQSDPKNARWLRWLEDHASEKTPELNRAMGQASGFRVFVRSA